MKVIKIKKTEVSNNDESIQDETKNTSTNNQPGFSKDMIKTNEMGKTRATTNNSQKQTENLRNAILSKQKADRDATRQKQRQVEDVTTSEEEDSSDDITLEELGEMVTASTGYEVTIPLYVTAAIDSAEKMQYYFEKDSNTGKSRQDPNGRCLNDGSTPLHLAIRSKQLEVVKILVQNGADLALTDSAGDNILLRAIQSSDANIINTVWPYRTEQLDINHINADGMSALHLAAEQRWECCLNFLLQNKADPNIQNTKTGITPLMIAAGNGDTKILENLLRAGAEIIMEDFEGFTCIYKAFEKKQTGIIKYLLKHITEEERELFIKARLEYVLSPPIPDEEKNFLSEMYFPLLVECTNYRELKPALYNQKAIHRIAYKMEEHIQSVDIVISGSHLLLCIMFRFSDTIDLKFLRQYLYCKGPDLTIEVTKYYTEVWKMSERSIIAVFLPMIGLAVIPEGRAWIKKHYLSVSEYINFFKKENLKQYIAPNHDFAWCLTKNQFMKIYKVWNRFYDVVTEIQTEQREKNMTELLQEEQREKDKQAKKKQKKKKKKQKKSPENMEPEDDTANENANNETQFEVKSPCRNDNARRDETFGQNVNSAKVSILASLVESPFSPIGEQWTTIQTRKNRNKEKTNPSGKFDTESCIKIVDDKHKEIKRKRNKKQANKEKQIPQPEPTVPASATDNSTRWADVAKVKPKHVDTEVKKITILKRDTTEPPKRIPFVPSDFPSLCGDSLEKRSEKPEEIPNTVRPGTFTFYFHEEPNIQHSQSEPTESVIKMSYDQKTDPQQITFLGDPVHVDTSYSDAEHIINKTSDEWTWENVAEIGEFGRKQYTEVIPEAKYTQPVVNENIRYVYGEKDSDNADTVEWHSESETKTDMAYSVNEFCTNQDLTPNDRREGTDNPSTHTSHLQYGLRANEDFSNHYEDTVSNRSEDVETFGCSLSQDTGNSSQSLYQMQTNNQVHEDVYQMQTNNQLYEDVYQMRTNNPFYEPVSQKAAASDLVHIDPAIIGCGGLHNEQRTRHKTNINIGTIPELSQLQTSRFLGNVISSQARQQKNADHNTASRSHKGWSNKRRMKKYDQCPPLSTNNWTFGEKLLKNARDLEDGMEMEGVCYPESLRGNKENEETHFFPSFHDDTRLSAQIDPRNFSLIHRLQQMQLAERRDFIAKSIKSTQDETLFAYYASCAGLNQQQYYQLIDQMRSQGRTTTRDPLRELIEKQQNDHQKHNHTNNGDTCLTWRNESYNENGSKSTWDSGQGESSASIDNAATNMFNYQSCSMGSKPFTGKPKSPVINPETIGIPVPETKPEVPTLPLNQSNIYAIQTAQTVMQMGLVNKIKELYKDIVKDKIKSVRWRENLWSMRNIPVERQMIISKMVIPANEAERHYISVSRHDSTVLGLLTDGTEVAIKIIDGQSREFTQTDLQYLVDIDVPKYFMVKYKDYCYHDGHYYIATDLYDYTLTDYLLKLKRDNTGRDRNVMSSKLIWQLMRGLESLHQSCLMVHGELKPENVVIDTDGNLRITGYGLSRNVGREGSFPEYTDEEKCWLSPEVLVHKQKVSFKADIWVAGMLVYYILSGGKNPFGSDIPNIIWNIGNQGHSMEYVNEEAGHLLKQMMSINKSERPSISEVLKHPYFWGQEKQLRFIIIAGSDVLRDVKAGVPMSGAVKDSMISIIGTSQCHRQLINWIPEIEPVVMREMKTFRPYKNNVVELVLFIYNCCTHFESLTELVREMIDEPCKYFLTKFPSLFMTVYKSVRKSSRAERTCYKAFF